MEKSNNDKKRDDNTIDEDPSVQIDNSDSDKEKDDSTKDEGPDSPIHSITEDIPRKCNAG